LYDIENRKAVGAAVRERHCANLELTCEYGHRIFWLTIGYANINEFFPTTYWGKYEKK